MCGKHFENKRMKPLRYTGDTGTIFDVIGVDIVFSLLNSRQGPGTADSASSIKDIDAIEEANTEEESSFYQKAEQIIGKGQLVCEWCKTSVKRKTHTKFSIKQESYPDSSMLRGILGALEKVKDSNNFELTIVTPDLFQKYLRIYHIYSPNNRA